MRIIINDATELNNVSMISEKKVKLSNDAQVYGLVININDSNKSNVELENIFSDVNEIKVVRQDLVDNETHVTFTGYNTLFKVERRISDESDTSVITLVTAGDAEVNTETVVEEPVTEAEEVSEETETVDE